MLSLIYGVVVYVLFFGSFVYAIGFVGNLGVPHSLDSPATTPWGEALAVNLVLLTLFALQHSVMARKRFKAWWTTIVPKEAERSTYVFAASACLFLLCRCWQPIDGSVWSVTNPAAAGAIAGVFWAGWGVLLFATFLINHLELFGLYQVFANVMGKKIPEPEFRTPLLYKYVRHPIYLGFIMSFWATAEMTWGHLLFAVGGTGYILVGIWFEERDLIAHFGDRYLSYRREVGILIPRIARRVREDVTKAG